MTYLTGMKKKMTRDVQAIPTIAKKENNKQTILEDFTNNISNNISPNITLNH